jgi:polyphosphate kinase
VPASSIPASPVAASPPLESRYLDRELSWLAFNQRVLELAEDTTVPLLERAKFLAIFASNLDEYFQIRVAGIKDKIVGGSSEAVGTLAAVSTETRRLLTRHDRACHEAEVALGGSGLAVVGIDSLGKTDREFLAEYFETRVFPILTPLAVDPAHPFPYISDLALSFGIIVERPDGRRPGFARVKVPPNLPRLVELPGAERYVYLEDVIGANLGALFPGSRIISRHLFRVTRDADIEIQEDEADDLLAAVEVELLQRRLGRAVRLEVEAGTPETMVQLLLEELDLEPGDVYEVDGRLDAGALWQLWRLDRVDLKDEPWPSVVPRPLTAVETDGLSIFDVVRRGDVLVHHPYESFTATVGAFVQQAAEDPDVLGIKMTLYRTSGDSPIVAALIRAAEEGKQVVALIELKARFDERNNIAWAKALERAGAHVVYGIVGLKTHAKAVLVVRTEGGRLTRYCHFGTGNGVAHRYTRLAVAPEGMRARILELIAEQADRPDGRVVLKMNSLVDETIIDALYAASAAGTQVDLVVRGICCLRPGVPGLSENIRVRSIVGRYLEHSRIYAFGEDAGPPPEGDNGAVPTGSRGHLLIGSADLMPRNLDRRVEVLAPVDDPAARRQLRRMLHQCLADDTNAWELGPDGVWRRVPTAHGRSAQRLAYEEAVERAALAFATSEV